MNKYQEISNGVYGDGWEIELIITDPGAAVGDTLAQFIANELEEDCHSIDDAIRRMGSAIDELSAVQLALIKAQGEGVV